MKNVRQYLAEHDAPRPGAQHACGLHLFFALVLEHLTTHQPHDADPGGGGLRHAHRIDAAPQRIRVAVMSRMICPASMRALSGSRPMIASPSTARKVPDGVRNDATSPFTSTVVILLAAVPQPTKKSAPCGAINLPLSNNASNASHR